MNRRFFLAMSVPWLLCCAAGVRAVDVIQSNVGIGCSNICIGAQCTTSCSNSRPAPTDTLSPKIVKNVNDFTAIRVEGSVDLELTHGRKHSVTVYADDDRLETATRGEALLLATHQSPMQPRIKVEATTPTLARIEALGDAIVNFSGFRIDHLAILTPNSAAAVKGEDSSIQNVKIHGSGAPDIDLGKARTVRAEVDVAGAADVRLTFPSERGVLSGRLADVSRLQVCGKPNRESLQVHDVAELIDRKC